MKEISRPAHRRFSGHVKNRKIQGETNRVRAVPVLARVGPAGHTEPADRTRGDTPPLPESSWRERAAKARQSWSKEMRTGGKRRSLTKLVTILSATAGFVLLERLYFVRDLLLFVALALLLVF